MRALLRDCLKSVFAQGESCEIIVVDNASNDDSVNMIRSEFPQVKIIANTNNAGFSGANNQGMDIATGKYIFLLNPDTEIRTGAMNALIKCCENHPENLLVGPRLENSDGSLQISAWKSPTPWNMIAESLFLHKIFSVSGYPVDQFDTMFFPGMISGAAMFFPRALYEKMGGLDPELFWMEDADFSKRAWDNDSKVVYYPSAVVVHHSGQSSKKNLKWAIANQLLSKLKYYRKHFGIAVMIGTSGFCLLHILTRLILFGLSAPFSQSSAEKAGAYWFTLGRYFRYLFTGDKSVT